MTRPNEGTDQDETIESLFLQAVAELGDEFDGTGLICSSYSIINGEFFVSVTPESQTEGGGSGAPTLGKGDNFTDALRNALARVAMMEAKRKEAAEVLE